MNFHCPSCGYFIIDRFDSWKRQRIAGEHSNGYMDSFRYSSNIKTGWVFYNSISAQMYFVRRKGESAFPAGSTPQGFSSQHSPLAMYRITEVLYNSLQLPHKGICCFILYFIPGMVEPTLPTIASSARRHAHPLTSQKFCLSTETRWQCAQHTIASHNSYRNGSNSIPLCYDWLIVLNVFGSWMFCVNANSIFEVQKTLPDKQNSWTEHWQACGAQLSVW
jgi:hypothetical protein